MTLAVWGRGGGALFGGPTTRMQYSLKAKNCVPWSTYWSVPKVERQVPCIPFGLKDHLKIFVSMIRETISYFVFFNEAGLVS